MSISSIKTYFKLALSSIQSHMEYKASFWIYLVTLLVYYSAQAGTIFILLSRFSSIGGWSRGEIAFLYSLLIFAQGIVASVFSGMVEFGSLVRDGSYDRYLLRPLSPIGQVLMNHFDITGLLHLVLGILTFLVANQFTNIEWTFWKVCMLFLSVFGSAMILAGIRIAIASIAFYAVQNYSLVHLFIFSSREFMMYPMNIYNVSIRILLTFLLPLGFVNFYPAHYFLAKNSESLFHPLFIYLNFPVGFLLFFGSLFIWKKGQRRYESTGT
ncbi:ABC-2 family transporter protein [Leptospira sp. FAT2]|uniref:ABC transporter permease n=1 Tax=Leptospira sanjuanensis TaxID=2879643 RepID=UPI001EE93B6F|nr:ABC-2 family transporter protein [Leptospira sanjuanensis]MCG6193941.1 ABC-2 family transporter protein [Leptospira sanjuanensis]